MLFCTWTDPEAKSVLLGFCLLMTDCVAALKFTADIKTGYYNEFYFYVYFN